MNRPKTVWPLLRRSDQPDDPRVRSYLIHKLSPLLADARAIVDQLVAEKDITIRRALLLSLGEFSEKEFTLDERKALLPKLQDMYQTLSDPGLHEASEWLLRKWKQETWLKQVNEEWARDEEQREKREEIIKQLLLKDQEKTPPQWYVNTQGQTMVVIPGPVEFLMGSPKSEKDRFDFEAQHKRRVGRSFAIAAKAVTWEQYLVFAPEDKGEREDKYSPSLDCPLNYINWYMAAAYCNWLSEKEGLESCYEIKGKSDAKLKEDYLGLTGYRLPTEAEMEYATRAGSMTSRYYGETEELLPKYAWYQSNSKNQTSRVGSLKPNDLGLFDVHGNVYTWCQERYKIYPKALDDKSIGDIEDMQPIDKTNDRVLRGGSFNSQASVERSASRYYMVPASRHYLLGFRLARTFIP
jgi:eukaryotic-like serine/threonine-protein kinase